MKRFLKNFILLLSLSNLATYHLNLNASYGNPKELNSLTKTSLTQDLQKDEYLIGPGDVLFLNLFDAEQFSGEYRVLNDGTINFPLIGNINLEFLTLKDATQLLQKKYSLELLRPELHLNVKKN